MITKEKLRAITVLPTAAIRQVASIIQNQDIKVVLVCSENGRLIGVVTDGDLRRALLNDIDVNDPVDLVMNRNPKVARKTDSRWELRELMRNSVIRHLPEVDEDGRVVGLLMLDTFDYAAPIDNVVVLMAGGKGVRLREYTENTPKPMLKVGGVPVLERMMQRLIGQGFHRFYISVNYLGHMVEDHFQDGSQWGVDIKYLRESEPLGTAGALSLLEFQHEPYIVANGDLITKTNFREIVEMCSRGVTGVMAVREYRYTVPYGCLDVDGDVIRRIDEKPSFCHFINAGIYCLAPESREFVRQGTYMDMTDLFIEMIESGRVAKYYNVTEEWIDIGSKEDFQWAQQLYSPHHHDEPGAVERRAA